MRNTIGCSAKNGRHVNAYPQRQTASTCTSTENMISHSSKSDSWMPSRVFLFQVGMADGGPHPLLVSKDPAPVGLLELTTCKCQKLACQRYHICTCKCNGMPCTEACFYIKGKTVRTVENCPVNHNEDNYEV